jgi:signal transduction histidine kinase
MELERAQVDLNSLLELVIDKFTLQAKHARVSLLPKVNQLPLVIGDSDRLTQVFTNLMDNAIKFTPAGGQVILKADPIGDQVRIAVKDSGEGIPQAEMPRIFERFYQLDKSRQGGQGRGVGLGLPIALEVIQAHSGKIYAHSKDGEGSVFIVDLPVARPDDSTMISRRNLVA